MVRCLNLFTLTKIVTGFRAHSYLGTCVTHDPKRMVPFRENRVTTWFFLLSFIIELVFN